MKTKTKYNSFRSLLDGNSESIYRELPDKFSLRSYLEKVRLIFPSEYGKAILLFHGEHNLISWISSYYLPRRPRNAKRNIAIMSNGFRLDFTPLHSLDNVWVKVKKKNHSLKVTF